MSPGRTREVAGAVCRRGGEGIMIARCPNNNSSQQKQSRNGNADMGVARQDTVKTEEVDRRVESSASGTRDAPGWWLTRAKADRTAHQDKLHRLS